ncbi:MAG: response regulator [Candidatus Eisenbacteria bacterium]|nr:response regulator [Candidatus Eisenbacteria bacterium]
MQADAVMPEPTPRGAPPSSSAPEETEAACAGPPSVQHAPATGGGGGALRPPEPRRDADSPAAPGAPGAQPVAGEVIRDDPLVAALMSSVNGVVFILDHDWRIVAANLDRQPELRLSLPDAIAELSPGDILRCARCRGENGNGDPDADCPFCGEIASVLAGQESREEAERDFVLAVETPLGTRTRRLSARAIPVAVHSRELVVLCLYDAAARQLSQAYERILVEESAHVINRLQGLCAELRNLSGGDAGQAAKRMVPLSETLLSRLRAEQALALAETNGFAVQREELRVCDFLDDLRLIMKEHPAAAGKHLNFQETPGDNRLTIDRSLLIQVIHQMLINALEASGPDETIEVSFTVRGKRGVFSVHNPGRMGSDVKRRVFQRFYTTKEGKGRGLGTYIMKLLGEHYLQGEVSFVSDEETGTTFCLDLPMKATAESQKSADGAGGVSAVREEPSPDAAKGEREVPAPLGSGRKESAAAAVAGSMKSTLGGLNILVADDTPALRKACARYLEFAGASVIEAADGQDAWEILSLLTHPLRSRELLSRDGINVQAALKAMERRDLGIDALVLDLSMPRLGGLELLERIRSDARLRRLPVVILSAERRRDTVLRCIRLRVSKYLIKPVKGKALVEAVKLSTMSGGSRSIEGPMAA